MRRVTVYCGSSMGSSPAYRKAAECMGSHLAEAGLELVYGGGNVGLMGVLANACLSAGGKVIGVIPEFLVRKEVAHRALVDLRVVGSMHQRKKLMAELGDGFVALPGGFGTFEEWLEMITWGQLGHHAKPCALLNVEGYFDPLLEMVRRGCHERFIRAEYLDMIISDDDPDRLLRSMEGYSPPSVEKWLDLERV